MYVSIIGVFGWKTPIYAYKIGFMKLFDPINRLQYQPSQKCKLLRESASYEPSIVKIWLADT